jgi:glyoxylase-like metal-dependent hydrolase (beta-lactamase superfamily II)
MTTKSDCFHRYHSYGEEDEPLRMDYFFWLVRDGERTIVVDTGFDPAVGARRGRTCLCPPVEALARLGVDPAGVSKLVLTHLHYDHTGNLDAFPAAEVYVPRRELEFWSGPQASRRQFAVHAEPDEIGRLVAAEREGRVRLVEGSEAVAPGVTLACVGGHSPGQAMVLVDGSARTIVLASDALHYYEELERDRPFDVVVDLAAMYEAYDTLRGLEEKGGVLVAGHDPAVCERFPSLDGEARGLGFLVSA